MEKTRIAEVRRFLESERERLANEIAEFESGRHDTLSEASGENNYRDHMADQGSATFARDLEMELEDNVREVLDAVDRALSRIDAGTYGKCRRCGEQIAEERLAALPTAKLCIACKEWEEGR
jgi:DnaK suppressor protein